MKRLWVIAGCVAALSGCASSGRRDGEWPEQEKTTLTRFDGSLISVAELESNRFSSIAGAKTIARLERALREPWAETRAAHEILSEVSNAHPQETNLAQQVWEGAEPGSRGEGRALFREYGFYRNPIMPAAFGPGIKPASLQEWTERLLAEHSDARPEDQLLATWRRFAPLIKQRQDLYLSSHWRFELDYVSTIQVAVNESLLGPHHRAEVMDTAGASFPGPTDSVDGYTAPALLLSLVAPGESSPVRGLIETLSGLADGRTTGLRVHVSPGRSDSDSDIDPDFLRAVLRGLLEGTCELDALPSGVKAFTVTFSYLLEDAEARSTLRFERASGHWRLTLFDYEPAAASLLSTDARLDLMPMIRALVGRNGAG